MGSVPFILYFIANGISSNIKWRMSAVWEKQKNQCMSRLRMRAGEELGLPGTAIPLGPADESEAVSKEGHIHKTSPPAPAGGGDHQREAVPWASRTLCPASPPHFAKKAAPDARDVQTHTQDSCRTRGHRTFPSSCERSGHAAAGVAHNSGSRRMELPPRKAAGRAGSSSPRAPPDVRSKGSSAAREAMASPCLGPSSRGVRAGRGRAQLQVWAAPDLLEQCPETCDGVRGCQAQLQSSSLSREEHLTALRVARGERHTHSPGTQHPRVTYGHQPATVLIMHRGSHLPFPIL